MIIELEILKELAHKYPNDADFGYAIRKIVNDYKDLMKDKTNLEKSN